jgi:hypothetical protein
LLQRPASWDLEQPQQRVKVPLVLELGKERRRPPGKACLREVLERRCGMKGDLPVLLPVVSLQRILSDSRALS